MRDIIDFLIQFVRSLPQLVKAVPKKYALVTIIGGFSVTGLGIGVYITVANRPKSIAASKPKPPSQSRDQSLPKKTGSKETPKPLPPVVAGLLSLEMLAGTCASRHVAGVINRYLQHQGVSPAKTYWLGYNDVIVISRVRPQSLIELDGVPISPHRLSPTGELRLCDHDLGSSLSSRFGMHDVTIKESGKGPWVFHFLRCCEPVQEKPHGLPWEIPQEKKDFWTQSPLVSGRLSAGKGVVKTSRTKPKYYVIRMADCPIRVDGADMIIISLVARGIRDGSLAIPVGAEWTFVIPSGPHDRRVSVQLGQVAYAQDEFESAKAYQLLYGNILRRNDNGNQELLLPGFLQDFDPDASHEIDAFTVIDRSSDTYSAYLYIDGVLVGNFAFRFSSMPCRIVPELRNYECLPLTIDRFQFIRLGKADPGGERDGGGVHDRAPGVLGLPKSKTPIKDPTGRQ